MTQNKKAVTEYAQEENDPVALVLKWILLFTALICFVVLIWGTYKTYQLAPPLPQQFQTQSGHVVMTEEDIVAGKAGFQRADLMDYGSLYGMGSYFGEDYTATYLLRLGRLVEEKIAQARYGKSFAYLAEEEQYLVRKTMQRELQNTDLSAPISVLSQSVADSIGQLKQEITSTLLNHDAKKGWTKAYSLDEQSALHTAEFLIYSSLTTIAHRPGQNSSYTNNWPYEPSMGNSPTPATFYWTWVSFCFVFLGFGVIL
ncbi:TPA: nitric oxide reductase, partial [Legionella pneumophila]|nr:nitric oxide reductase [Legionella pneumophila]